MYRWRTRRGTMARNMLSVEVLTPDNKRVCVVSIDQPDSKANVMSRVFFDELNIILDNVKRDILNHLADGVIFISKKPSIFLAGANLEEMTRHVGDDEAVEELIEYGQQTFDKIQSLSCVTVAAIHGVCLGGGLELALACDYRVASNDPKTKIGLPEVMLGILPAWGGCTRLPRLIGVIKALKFILSGTPKHSVVCKKLGIVDKVVYKENITDTAISIINKPPVRKLPRNWKLFNWLIFKKTKDITLRKTKGNYPAPLEIINVISKGIKGSSQQSLNIEKRAFIKLVNTDECKNLIRIFFLQEASKKLKYKGIREDLNSIHAPNNIVVQGAGTMGAGICQWLATRGKKVLLKDISSQQISTGLKSIGNLFVQGVLKHKFDRPVARGYISNISTATDNVSLKNKDLVIEVIAEDFDIKTKVLTELEKQCGDDTIIATNTSALSITKLAENLQRPERFIGIHFFNPVHKMKLVEVVIGEKTDWRTIAKTLEFVKSIGKLPVLVQDSPGFLVNSILLPYLVKAIQLVEAGASPSEIDSQMVKFGMPMGPLRLLDEIGLDVGIHVARDLKERLEGFSIPACTDDILEKGDLGKKTGTGFYVYEHGRKVGENTSLLNLIQKHTHNKKVDAMELIDVMVDEAHKCLLEGIVDSPDMLDFAMIMGTGWAPFRGGPLQFSKQ